MKSFFIVAVLGKVLFQSQSYASCPQLSGQYHCKSETRQYSLKIKQRSDGDLRSIFEFKKTEGDRVEQDIVTVDQSYLEDFDFLARCQENELIIPLLDSTTGDYLGEGSYLMDPVEGDITLTHPNEKWICSRDRRFYLQRSNRRVKKTKRYGVEDQREKSRGVRSPKKRKVLDENEKKFQCDECSTSYAHRSSLNRHQKQTGHVQNVDRQVEDYICDQCGHTVPTEELLDQHYSRVHSNH